MGKSLGFALHHVCLGCQEKLSFVFCFTLLVASGSGFLQENMATK